MTSESSAKLLERQRQLAAEELSLKQSLQLIDQQINVLQVEQLNLLEMLNKSSKKSKKSKKTENCKPEENVEAKTEDLDLSVPLHLEVYADEEEEEDDEDDL